MPTFRPRLIPAALLLVATLATGLLAQGGANPPPTGQPPEGAEPAGVPVLADLPENNPDFDNEAESKIFEELISQWRETLAEMAGVMIRFKNSDETDDRKFRQKFLELEQVGREQFDRAFESAFKLVQNAPRDNMVAAQFLLVGAHYRFDNDWFEQTGEASEALMRVVADPELNEIAGISFLATNQFDKAEQYLRAAAESGNLSEKNMGIAGMIDEARVQWDTEQALREEDERTGDLPRVRLKTTRGDIVLELFEDQTPNTVANFVRLVEEGQYDDAPFYQVINGRIAMVGDAYGDRAGSVEFTIADEDAGPKRRGMFRGSVAMAELADPTATEVLRTLPDTASTHFMIAFVPLPAVTNEHTVFGRIVEGMANFSALTRLDPSEEKEEGAAVDLPDRIIVAEVVRKRDHIYEPERIERSPFEVAAQ